VGKTKYSDVKVSLDDIDGNAFVLLAHVRRELRRAGASEEEIQEFTDEATADDYDHLLGTITRWVDIT
jgi:hypothetical protein